MALKIFINNFAADITKNQLRTLFEISRDVQELAIIRDKFTNESREFRYVKMPVREQALRAIAEVNGKIFQG